MPLPPLKTRNLLRPTLARRGVLFFLLIGGILLHPAALWGQVSAATPAQPIAAFDIGVGHNYFQTTQANASHDPLLSYAGDQLPSSPQPLMPAVASTSKTSTSEHAAWLTDKPNARKKIDLTGTLQRLAWSTSIMLVIGFLAILLIKKSGWFQPFKTSAPAEPSLIKRTIPLGRQSFLHLIQVEGAHLVVGIDQNGIKSILKTSSSFEQDLDAITPEELSAIAKTWETASPENAGS